MQLPRVELQFHIYDGTNICRNYFSPTLTIRAVKRILVEQWPEDRTIRPGSVNELTLIFQGKTLKNRKSLAQSGLISGDSPHEALTVQVTVKPSKKTGTGMCSCLVV